MQVRTGGVAGLAHNAQHLPRRDHRPSADEEILHVGVKGLVTVRVQDTQVVAIAGMLARYTHYAVCCGQHRRAGSSSQVMPQMEVRSPTAHGVGAPAVTGGTGTGTAGQREQQREVWRVTFLTRVGGRLGFAAGLAGCFRCCGQSLGDGFNVKDIWEKARRNWGQLFAVTLIPMAIVIGISLVLSIVVFSIMFLCIMGAAPTIAAIGGAADPSFAQIMSLIVALAGPMIFCTLILYVVLSVAETFAEAVAIRGVAHWVARYAPEWTTLSAPRY